MNKKTKKILTYIMALSISFTGFSSLIDSGFDIHANTRNKEGLNVDNVDGVKIKKAILPYSKEHRPQTPMKPKYITIHNTANEDYGADAQMHNLYLQGATEEEYVSWHFTVDNKVIYQHLPLNEIGYHAGDGGNGAGNQSSIAIEICENADGNYAKAEKNASKLVAELLYEYDMDISAVVPHKHWSGKECPNNMLYNLKGSMGWNGFKKAIQMELDKIVIKNLSPSAQSEKLNLKIGETVGLLLYTSDNSDNYTLSKDSKSKYALSIQESKEESVSKAVMNDVSMNYNQAVLINESDYHVKDAKKEFDTLLKNKDNKISTFGNDIFDIKTRTFTNTGIAYLTFSTEKGNTRFVVYNYVGGNPIITTNIEAFVKLGSAMDLLMNNQIKAQWASSNADVVEITDGKITGKKPGKAVITAKIDGIEIRRNVTVES